MAELAHPYTLNPNDSAFQNSDSLGRRFARARLQSDLTQTDIAEALGWKRGSTISGLERGIFKIHLHQLDRWAAILGKRVELVDITKPATAEELRAEGEPS